MVTLLVSLNKCLFRMQLITQSISYCPQLTYSISGQRRFQYNNSLLTVSLIRALVSMASSEANLGLGKVSELLRVLPKLTQNVDLQAAPSLLNSGKLQKDLIAVKILKEHHSSVEVAFKGLELIERIVFFRSNSYLQVIFRGLDLGNNMQQCD